MILFDKPTCQPEFESRKRKDGKKPKIIIKKNSHIYNTNCPKCKRFSYIVGIGCTNCDVEVIEEQKERT